MDDTETTTSPDFDWTGAAERSGATAMQMRFAKALSEGYSQAGAAKKAGYAGTDDQLRTVGSRSARSPAVRRLIAFAKAAGATSTATVATLHESMVTMSELMRNGSQATRVAAAKALEDLKARQVAESASAPRTPEEVTADILAISPITAEKLYTAKRWPMPDYVTAAADAERKEVAVQWIRENLDATARLVAEISTQTVATPANGHAEHAPAAATGARLNDEG